MRHLLEPIEQLFQREFPEYDPYPWGQRAQIALLIRNILLAEPLVAQFGRCFTDVTPQEAQALAGCFAFDQCVRREATARILREHLTDATDVGQTGNVPGSGKPSGPQRGV